MKYLITHKEIVSSFHPSPYSLVGTVVDRSFIEKGKYAVISITYHCYYRKIKKKNKATLNIINSPANIYKPILSASLFNLEQNINIEGRFET